MLPFHHGTSNRLPVTTTLPRTSHPFSICKAGAFAITGIFSTPTSSMVFAPAASIGMGFLLAASSIQSDNNGAGFTASAVNCAATSTEGLLDASDSIGKRKEERETSLRSE